MDSYSCGKCKTTKPESEFFRSQRKNGAWCRECFRVRYGKRAPHPSRPCSHCAKIMVDPNPKAMFCTDKCKNAARIAVERQIRMAKRVGRTCANCGVSIEDRRIDTKWCSAPCAQKRPTRKATARRAALKANYGISEADYLRLVKKQRGLCAICRSDDPKHRQGTWHIDHDHVTGQVRGLLCSRCNTGIGQLQDDPEIIRTAARYIQRHRGKTHAARVSPG